MLFASTRLTLVRELGSEHFRDAFFATTPEELSPAGFEKHDAHSAVAAPLTEEERSLGEVRRAEQEAGMGTGSREIHLSKNMAMPVAEDALQALRDLGAESRSLVMLVSAAEFIQGFSCVFLS
jgi:twinfilin-like protein